jgi:hypothetical protein
MPVIKNLTEADRAPDPLRVIAGMYIIGMSSRNTTIYLTQVFFFAKNQKPGIPAG